MNIAKVMLLGGALFEFVGIVAKAFPDAVPYAVRLSTWLREQTRALVDRICRLLGRPRHVIREASAGSFVTVGGRASLGKVVRDTATIAQKVEFLLTRDQEAQRDVNKRREQLEDLATGSSKRREEVRREIETRFAGELTSALEDYRSLRVLGTIAFVIGLTCATWANFID